MHCTAGDWKPGGEKDTIITKEQHLYFFPSAQSEQEEKRILLERAAASERMPGDNK